MALPGILVSTQWLAAHLGEPDLRVFDTTCRLVPDPGATFPFRAESGRPHYLAGHVPGGGFLDLLEDLSDKRSALRFTMPSAEQFGEALSRAGVGPATRVVLYSARPNFWATRIGWMLRAFGFDAAAVLDGGWEKWHAEGRPVSTEPTAYPPALFVPRPRPDLLARKADVLNALDRADTRMLNALAHTQHVGESDVHYGRPGHIKGSGNLPYLDLLDPIHGTFLPEADLRAKLDESGALDAKRVVTYCGGGIGATTLAFAMALVGRGDDVAVYDGSLSEWCADPSLPMETG
jgi:thiosulfate/3-mercaptopyruvate sulfurtransferase